MNNGKESIIFAISISIMVITVIFSVIIIDRFGVNLNNMGRDIICIFIGMMVTLISSYIVPKFFKKEKGDKK